MNLINPKQFQQCFADWMHSCHQLTQGEVIAIDGKTLRGSYDKRRRTGAIHRVNAFSTANGVVLGQVKTDEKSNEINAIPELLKLLSVSGCLVSDVIGDFVELSADWPALKTLGVALSFRTTNGEIPENATVRYYISSAALDARQFAEAIRNHWFIENQFHWRLDVAMSEDDSRIRREKAAENLAAIRHIAFNLLNSHKTFKAGMKRKQKKAAMNADYLSELLMAKGFS